MAQQAVELARRFCVAFLELLGEKGEVEARLELGELYLNLRGPWRLLPQDSAFRSQLGRVLRLYLQVQLGREAPLTLDINGELAAHRAALAERARQLAQTVRSSKQKVELEPMSPEDRRTVHLALADIPGVRTYSVGRGHNRRVVIEPAEQD